MNAYGSHIPVLTEIIKHIPKTVVFEYGMGDFSTPFFCENFDRVIACEMQDEKWYEKIKESYVPKYPNLKLYCEIGETGALSRFTQESFYSMVFVDGSGANRWECINLAFDKTPVIVAHDTEASGYRWEKVTPPRNTDYVWLDITEYIPWTSVITTDKTLIQALQEKFKCKIREFR